jgi:hypothetical protein
MGGFVQTTDTSEVLTAVKLSMLIFSPEDGGTMFLGHGSEERSGCSVSATKLPTGLHSTQQSFHSGRSISTQHFSIRYLNPTVAPTSSSLGRHVGICDEGGGG